MVTSEAHVETTRSSRYLVQLCRHVDNTGTAGRHLRGRRPGHLPDDSQARPDMQPRAEWTETDGVISFRGGRCTMQAGLGGLTLRAEAADEETLRRFEGIVAGQLARFGRRDHLSVRWQRA